MLALAVLIAAAGAVTAKNWKTHPTVVASRAIYEEVKQAVDGGKLATRVAEECAGEFTSMTVATDGAGVIRYTRYETGGDDSSHAHHHYYDARGRLRFVFARVGAVPSAWVEAR